MYNLEEIILGCNSTDKIIESKYGGKSGKTLFYKVLVATNPIEFLLEIRNIVAYDTVGLGVLESRNEPDVVYVGKLVEDLFDYLYNEGYFDDKKDVLVHEMIDEVAKVVNYIKKEKQIIDYDWWMSITPETYDKLLSEANDQEEEVIDLGDYEF